MNESLMESAHLYALGLLTTAEQAAFDEELRSNPALRGEVHAFQEAALALAKSVPQVAPPPQLRADLLAAFNELPLVGLEKTVTEPTHRQASVNKVIELKAPPLSSSPQVSVQPKSSSKVLQFIPWAAAAAMAVLLYQNKDAIASARQQTATAQNEVIVAKEREKHFLEAIKLSESAKAESDTALAGLRGQLAKSETTLNTLETERETLRMELAALRDDSQLDKTRIAVLGSLLKDQPQAVAVSLWRQESQDGLLVVENMPALPPGRDYQLWVIDPNLKTPVSAGVFKVDAAGKVRLEFKPARNVQSAYKFAVTIEKEGGVMVPTLDQMVVIGG